MAGLTLIGLPIGNSEDITLRAKEKLKSCGVIVAEDTRVLKDLLKRLDIDYSQKNIFPFHDHSSDTSLKGILDLMSKEEVAYVSDAGSPSVSDPAMPLVNLAINNDLEVNVLPGPSAVITALEISGLPATPFHFHGFLPREKGKIQEFAREASYGTHILFEGVSRVKKTLAILCDSLPDCQFAVCRELTKTYQSVYRFKGEEWFSIKESIEEKGEFVLLIHNHQKKAPSSAAGKELAEKILKEGAKPKLLSKLLAELTGRNSKEVYSELKR